MKKESNKAPINSMGIILLTITIVVLLGIFWIILGSSEDKTPATYEQVWNSLTEHDCTALDYTEHFSEKYSELDFEYAISCRDDNIYVDFFQFSNVEDANIAYSRFNTVINKNFSRDAVETGGDMRNFTVRTYLYEGEYHYLMRIENTVLYCESTEEYKNLVIDIAFSLGYKL